jgi:hypothetical protein
MDRLRPVLGRTRPLAKTSVDTLMNSGSFNVSPAVSMGLWLGEAPIVRLALRHSTGALSLSACRPSDCGKHYIGAKCVGEIGEQRPARPYWCVWTATSQAVVPH